MSTDTDDRDLDDLLNRFYQAVERFKEGHDDLQRMETLNNARRLVQVLEKPGERALLTGLSVSVFWKILHLKHQSNCPASPFNLYV